MFELTLLKKYYFYDCIKKYTSQEIYPLKYLLIKFIGARTVKYKSSKKLDCIWTKE